MPIYFYLCEACGETLEEIQLMSDPALLVCPMCGECGLRRVLTLPNAIVHGSPKTIGQLAEDNTRKLVQKYGQEKADQMIHENTYGKGGKKLKLPTGASIIPKSDVLEIPWFRTGEVEGTGPRSELPLDVTTIKNPAKYIHTGDKD